MISYAQNREDVLLARVFREREHGFYVDVGAFDPHVASVTKHFYDQGWTGINLEPGPIFQRLAEERPRDVNLNVAASDRAGPVTYYEHADDPGTSTLATELDPALAHLGAGRTARRVEAVTLRDVLERCNPPEIDFLKVDVEGHERQVLLGNDWTRFRPRVLVIEATLPYSNTPCHERWEDVVLQAGYLFAHFDGLNRYYVRQEDAALLERLAFPVNVLDQYVAVETIHYQQEAQQLWAGLHEERARLKGIEAECERARAEADRLAVELQQAEAGRVQNWAEVERLAAEYHRAEVERAKNWAEVERVAAAYHQAEAGRVQAWTQAERLAKEVQRVDARAGQLATDCHGLNAAIEEMVRRHESERGRWQAEMNRLGQERARLLAEKAALVRGTGARSLRLGLRVARAVYRLKHPFAA